MTAKTARKAAPPKPAPQEDLNVCGCGCGEATKSTFRPGHDARHAGITGRALAANPKDKAALADLNLMTPSLRAKAERIRDNAIAKAEKSEAESAA